ncbi:hypothetical protein AAE478_006478 [Parahypoxylon ruwenzoriense]
MDTDTDIDAFLSSSYAQIRAVASVPAGTAAPTLPSAHLLSAARSSLPSPQQLRLGIGPEATIAHLTSCIAPALTGQNRSGRYFGFVTGSCLPVAEAADNLVSALDQNVQVHLPAQSVATDVEDAALTMLLRLLELDRRGGGAGEQISWAGRTFTTGATASNILGLACGREAVIASRLPREMKEAGVGVGELGLLDACAAAKIRGIQVLSSMGHSSLSKAAAVVGLGRACVRELPRSKGAPWALDLDAVERELRRGDAAGVASIVAVSAGEVNTGRFATAGAGADMRRLRELADRHGAWIHVDGAFGIFARALPATDEFARLREAAAGLELADSITVDGHKLLNVPYDTGIFFTRSSSTLHAVFQNPNAAYLSSPSSPSSSIPSPLNIGLENSRRFRALPVYAVLLSSGREGIAAMLARMVRVARGIAGAIARDLAEDYELLPASGEGEEENADKIENTHVVTLFRARDPELNDVLVAKIQGSGEWYVSGTRWDGRPACRIAVASWRVDVDKDVEFVRDSLARIAREWKEGQQ